MKVFGTLQTPVKSSASTAASAWLQVAPVKRHFASGQVREAARRAKSELLRTVTAASAAQADRASVAVSPGFLDLAVDDRVLVGLSAEPCSGSFSACKHARGHHQMLKISGPFGRDLCTSSHCNSASSHSCSSCWQKCGTSVLHRLWQGVS